MPRIEESLDCLNGACIFSSLDLKSSYWQVELDDNSIPMTAFMVGPLGFYKCVRMPLGLTNAPATFQQLMESCLGELHLNWCIIDLDNIIIHSRTPDKHIIRLQGVFERLRAAGLKLKPSKCTFFKDCIAYLGHIVSKQGIEVDPKKVEVIKKWPRPKTVTDVRSFHKLGFTNYYRKFMFHYAQIAKPLNELTSGENASKKNKDVEWLPKHQVSFEQLKELSSKSLFKTAEVSHTNQWHSEYGNQVPIQLGTLHIDMILEKANPEQLAKLGKAYKPGEVGRPIQSKE